MSIYAKRMSYCEGPETARNPILYTAPNRSVTALIAKRDREAKIEKKILEHKGQTKPQENISTAGAD